MAFALTSYWAGCTNISSPSGYRCVQQVKLTITGTTADIDLDIGDDSGTFWTDALADGTYGEMAEQAQDHLQLIISNAVSLKSVYSPEIDASGVRAAAASGTAYTLAFEESRPNWTFDTAQGLEAYTVYLEYLLDPNVLGFSAAYNVTT